MSAYFIQTFEIRLSAHDPEALASFILNGTNCQEKAKQFLL